MSSENRNVFFDPRHPVDPFQSFQDKLIALEKEITGLKNKLTYKRIPTASDFVSQKPPSTEVHEATESPPEVSNEERKNHPRSGDYKDDDVSIEKFFYIPNRDATRPVGTCLPSRRHHNITRIYIIIQEQSGNMMLSHGFLRPESPLVVIFPNQSKILDCFIY